MTCLIGACDSTGCKECLKEADGTQLRNLTNQCTCNDGYFNKVDTDGTRSCQPCMSGCKKCTSSSDCSLCHGDLQFLESACKCATGTFPTATDSTKCSSNKKIEIVTPKGIFFNPIIIKLFYTSTFSLLYLSIFFISSLPPVLRSLFWRFRVHDLYRRPGKDLLERPPTALRMPRKPL